MHVVNYLTDDRLTALKGRPEYRIPALNLDSALQLDDMPADNAQDANEPRTYGPHCKGVLAKQLFFNIIDDNISCFPLISDIDGVMTPRF